MAHKTLVNGTAYEVKGGKCLVNGTSYDIKKGRTLIGGTGYDITFQSAVTTSDNGKFLRVVNGAWAAVKIANANGGSF